MKPATSSPLLLVIAMAAWGSLYPVSKILMSDLHPLTLSFFRYFFGILPLIPFYIIDKRKRNGVIPLKDHLRLLLLGQLGVTLFALFLFLGLKRSSGANGSLLANTQPVFAALLAPILIHEKITRAKIMGIFMGLLGIILVTAGTEAMSVSFLQNILTPQLYLHKGTLMLLSAAFCMTLYSVLLRSFVQKHGGFSITFLTMVWGSLSLFLIAALRPGGPQDFLNLDSPRELFLILYLGVAATAFPYLLFNKALGLTGVVTATGYKFLIPVSGVILSVILLKESLYLLNITGITIVLISVIYLQKKELKDDL